VSDADVQNLRQKLSQSEEERRRLDKECAIYQSQLEVSAHTAHDNTVIIVVNNDIVTRLVVLLDY